MQKLTEDAGAPWRRLAPILDEAITELGSADRAAIVLRYFEQRDFSTVGEALGSSEDAARVRVNRALAKLRLLLTRRGVTLSAGGLAEILTSETVHAAPAGLALTISSTALVGAVTSTATALTLIKFMATTKLKLSAAALILAGATTTALVEYRSKVSVQDSNRALRQEIAQLHLENRDLSRMARPLEPLPPGLALAPFPVSAKTAPPDQRPSIDLYSYMTNKAAIVKLTPEQVELYLKENGRNAASLLSAFRTSDNPALLQEAQQNFPDDPQVNFESALAKDSSPAQKRKALDTLKKAAPENALAYYLSAADHFKAGQRDDAVQDLTTASSKTEFHDYALERNQADEEAFRAAGYSVAQANVLAAKQLTLPQLVQAKELSGNLLDLAKSYQQSGDETSGQAVLEMAAGLGRRYSEPAPGETLLARLLGIGVESTALGAMDANSTYPDSNQTVQDRRTELQQQRATIRELAQQADPIWQSLSDQDWISYQTRSAKLGEEAAMRWLVDKFAAK